MQINAVMILLALAFWAWLWGIAGIVVAVPMLVTFRVLCSHVPALAPYGEFMAQRGDSPPGRLTTEQQQPGESRVPGGYRAISIRQIIPWRRYRRVTRNELEAMSIVPKPSDWGCPGFQGRPFSRHRSRRLAATGGPDNVDTAFRYGERTKLHSVRRKLMQHQSKARGGLGRQEDIRHAQLKRRSQSLTLPDTW